MLASLRPIISAIKPDKQNGLAKKLAIATQIVMEYNFNYAIPYS